MVDPQLVNQLLKELERERGIQVQLSIETAEPADELKANEGEYLGAFYDRGVTVTRVEGRGAEYDIAARFAGDYASVADLLNLVERTQREELSPEKMNGPMNICRFSVKTDGIFAIVHGTYGPDGTESLRPHPGFENAETPYKIKVADLSLKFIE
ncbi:MAG TPA: hypothetical protein VJI15_02620 [Candidatus Nanoarchaeia archaeon]|nr:hypothetical protein [Candidatus Nanoarchaeia archaeon]